ncbi:putative GrpE protein like protein, mitochondrial [Calycina marina]|uniref:GrpE protein homolog n=1 Tax=Calycina marina TaxID=1763456 RepID=A0A9P8CJ63_9HELO|nr:putative GrpE protein like protein, mitochondrial [Calycina marina]
MISRTVARQSRSLTSCLRTSSKPSLPHSQFNTATRIAPSSCRPISATRWYSSESEKKSDGEQKTELKENEASVADPLKKELQAKDKEIIELKDKYLRQVAEFRNLQERTKRDMQTARDFAIQKFAKDLVDSIDNFDRALSMVPPEKLNVKDASEHQKDLIGLHEGLKMTENILMSTLKKHGLERFDPAVEGEKFNPNEHEATFMTPMADKEDNTVIMTQQKGFKLNGRILRAAKVGVVKNS